MKTHNTKRLELFVPNRDTALKELASYKLFLSSKKVLAEKADLLPFFQQHKQLIALLGCLHGIKLINRIGWEFDLFGDYEVDFVAGDSKTHTYCFIEFQDATKNSIFQVDKRSNGIWAHSFEEGFGQIIDWSYKLADNEKSEEFDNRFEAQKIHSTFVIVVGRSSFLNQSDYKRFDWRRRHITLDNNQIECLTFDELLEHYETLISFLPSVVNQLGKPKSILKKT